MQKKKKNDRREIETGRSYKLRRADRQIGDNHSHGKIFKGIKTFQGTHFRNHNDARDSGKTPELNFDKRKRLQCYECGYFNHLRPQCPNLKTQKVELCRIGVKSEGSFLDPYTSKGIVNGFRMSILRDTGATVDVICQKYADRDRIKGEHVWVRHLLDDHMTCLPVAEGDIECDLWTGEILPPVDCCSAINPATQINSSTLIAKQQNSEELAPINSEVSIKTDAYEPMHASTEDNNKLLTIRCFASKYPDVIPVSGKTSKSVIEALLQTNPEQPDEEATYKEKLDLQLRKDRCYTLIYTNISSDSKNLITETTDGVAAWKILKDHFEPVTRARVIQLLDQFFGTKYQPGEDVGIFISRVKTAATRLQEAGHKLDDLYIGFQLIRWLPQEFQSTVQQIYRWKEDFRVVKIEAELILEANRLQLMKQDLEKAENAYLSSFTSKKSKTLPGATAAAHGDPNGKNDYQKKRCLLELDKQLVTSSILFEENFDKGVWVIDTAATSHFCNDKSLFLDLKPITNMKMSLETEDKSCPVEGIGTLRFRPDHYIIPKSKEISFFSDVTAKTKNGSIEIWHQRFCHVNNNYLVKTSKNDSVKGLPRLTDNGKTHCIPCKLAKSKRVSFKKTGAVRSKRPLELLHMDLCGPMPTESQGGNKYFLSIIDDYSRKVTVFTIRNKSDVFHTFIRFQKRAKRFLSKKVIAVRTDGGLEFCNKDMDNFLTELGIKHETKVNSNLGYNLNLPGYYDDEDDSDRVKDSLTSRLVSKTSTETPSTSEKPEVSSDNHSLIPCTEVKWIRNIGRKVTGSNVYYSIEGEATRLKSFNEIERYCKWHNIEYDPSLFNFRKNNAESQGFSDLTEQ
ncbi:retrovirus-related Pol polyprotein from transposon TNT 1-94 [Trichonephila clavipes]|nr:retrovirus-related Pol polyprotein from transposon TNT 1-94 [Trichonephila clavipes]